MFRVLRCVLAGRRCKAADAAASASPPPDPSYTGQGGVDALFYDRLMDARSCTEPETELEIGKCTICGMAMATRRHGISKLPVLAHIKHELKLCLNVNTFGVAILGPVELGCHPLLFMSFFGSINDIMSLDPLLDLSSRHVHDGGLKYTAIFQQLHFRQSLGLRSGHFHAQRCPYRLQ